MQDLQIEQLGALERRICLAVELQAVEFEIANRLKHISRTVRMDGFRHGKVPMTLVNKQYGGEVRQEVLNLAIEKLFTSAVTQHQLKVAGYPRIEPKAEVSAEGLFEFYASFEIYPEIEIGDLSQHSIQRPVVVVGDAEVDKTLSVLAKQRTQFVAVDRTAQTGDRVTVDFVGSIEGIPFAGGEGKDMALVIGAGRTLPAFENGVNGMTVGEQKTVDVTFPEDYQATELAGKTAQFVLTLHEVTEPRAQEIDAEFARSLGVENGNVEHLRSEIRINLEREVSQRVRTRVKRQAMDVLLAVTPITTPKALVHAEAQHLMKQAQEDSLARGMEVAESTLPVDLIEQQAQKRVALGLILSEIVQKYQLTAQSVQVMGMIETLAQSYENPQEVEAWYCNSPEKMQEMTSLAMEDNVVDWVLQQVNAVDQQMGFEELMSRGENA